MRIIALILVLVIAGCVSRPAESPESRALTPAEAISIHEKTPNKNQILPDKPGKKVSILALSGGGADGAYGVGVLNGWTKTGTRPNFDIVTGSSTGALMSVFAFLGPDYDELLKTLYLSQTDSDIFIQKGLIGPFSDSLYDNTPLKKQIEKFVTDDILAKIVREHNKGRRLYVSTTNLDSNELIIWDMGLLASGGAKGRTNSLQLFQKVLRASAAIPVLFPPVYIKPQRGVQLRQAHADGGVKAPVILSDFLFSQKAASRELYVIVNGSLALENAHSAVTPNLKDVATKAVTGLTSELAQQAVYRGYVRALNSGTKFNLTAIPEDIPPLEDALEFNAKHLKRIFDRGYNEVQLPGFWWSEPPTLKRFDRIARN